MLEAAGIAAILGGLFVIDWRYRSRIARVLALLSCLALWWYSLPNFTIAGRRASASSAQERVTQIRGDSLSDYFSGVATMRAALESQHSDTLLLRFYAIGGLAWLALAPIAWRAKGSGPVRPERLPLS